MTDQKNINDLEELYVQLFSASGFPFEMSRETIKAMIKTCQEESQKEGTDRFPENFGNILIEDTNRGIPYAKNLVDTARKEGATDEDITKYWNLSDLERRVMTGIDNIFRIAAYNKNKDEGLPNKEAVIKLNKSFPFYGNPNDTSKSSGDNRPLPFELKDRINIYLEKNGYSLNEEKIKGYDSMNAFLRSEFKKGCI